MCRSALEKSRFAIKRMIGCFHRDRRIHPITRRGCGPPTPGVRDGRPRTPGRDQSSAGRRMLGAIGVSLGRTPILDPSHTSGSYLRSAARFFIGMSALSVQSSAGRRMLGVIGVSLGRTPILDPSHTSGSYLRSATRSFIGMSALSVMWMPSGHTSVQHLVMLQ